MNSIYGIYKIGVNVQEIDTVSVYIYPNAIKLAGIRIPADADETKFSIQYTLACVFSKGAYGIEDMDSPRLTEDILDLIGKISLIPDEKMEDRSRGIRGTRVEVILKDGTRAEETILVPRGDPEVPLTRDDIIEKLGICAAGLLNETVQKKLVTAIGEIGGDGVFENPMKITGEVQ